MGNSQLPIAVAFTGASGIQYGLRLVECLLAAERRVYLMVSQAAQVVINMETDLQLPGRPGEMQTYLSSHFSAKPGQLQVFGRQQWTAPVASGSNPPEAVVICPCTTGTLASVANGICDDLIDRAADVALKERRKLILVVRETPFSTIHLENMLRLVTGRRGHHAGQPRVSISDRNRCRTLSISWSRGCWIIWVLPHALSERWGDESLSLTGQIQSGSPCSR